MTTKMMKSPAGESIQITSDEEWADAVGTSLASLKQWYGPDGLPGMKPLTIRALWEHGEFSNASGRTASEIMQWVQEHFPRKDLGNQSNIMSAWGRPQNMPAVIANTNGKRTFSLKLVALPESWHRKLMADIERWPIASTNGDQADPVEADRAAAETVAALVMPADGPQVPQEATEQPGGTNGANGAAGFTDADWAALELDAPTVYEMPPPMELQVANQVAMSLLTTVVEIISAGTADTTALSGSKRLQEQLGESQHLLSQRLMENDKLRRQLREAADHINALKTERDGLRSRLRMTEHNLTEVLKGETAQAVNSEIQKRVDQIMRQPPAPKGD